MTILDIFPTICTLQDINKKHSFSLFLVGGVLRDLILKRPVTKSTRDIDIAVSSNAILMAQKFAKAIKGKFILLDEKNGCARVAKKKNHILWTYDFADFRSSSLKKDLLKRDFTINTLTVDLNHCDVTQPLIPQIQDSLGALKDIRKKTIRMTSKDVFVDDPLRLLRAYSLSAQLNFSIEKKTIESIQKNAKSIVTVSFERIREELFKILETPRASQTFERMDQAGLLSRLIPQIDAMRHIGKGVYHHLPVWKHSLCALLELEKLFVLFQSDEPMNVYLDETIASGHSRRAILRLACLLHDVGKPDTKKDEPQGRVSFHGHERVGAQIVRHIAKNLLISTKERHILENMVALHLRPGYLSNFKTPSKRMVFRFMKDAQKETVSILLLAWADQNATRGPQTTLERVQHHQKMALSLITQYFEEQNKEPFVPLLNGYDLIRILKLKPAPIFSTILSAVQEAQCLGKITTQEQALDMARRML